MNDHAACLTGGKVRLARLVGALATVVSCMCAADTASPAPAEPRTHTVFIGVDLSAKIDGQMRRVIGISKAGAEFEGSGGQQRVRPEALRGVVFERGPKVSAELVDLDEIKVEPSFASGGVVDQAWAQSVETQWIGEAIMDVVEGRSDLDSESLKVREAVRELRDAGLGANILMREMAKKKIEAGDVQHGELEDDARRDRLFDALDVSFLVSSPAPVTDSYVVMMCTIRVNVLGRTRVGQVFYFCEIGKIDEQPRRMKAQFTGLPTGFHLLRAEFHVYSGARELASNVAPQRVQLTERQANQFLTLQYVFAHKAETLPAKLASAPPLSESLKKLAAADPRLPLRISVDPAGAVIAVAAPSAPLALREYVAALRFFPALENGTAVASTQTVELADLVR